jgi:transcription-repair coupling factor (superfamily II helicase)
MRSEEFRDTLSEVSRGAYKQHLLGLAGSQKSLYVAGLSHHSGRPVFVVTYSQQEAERLSADISTLLGPDRALIFPPVDLMPYEETPMSADLAAARAKAQMALVTGRQVVVIAPVRALGRRMVPPRVVTESLRRLRVGDTVDLSELEESLAGLGYERLGRVDARGQASVRGGIIDIFPRDADEPVRIELFGDEVESLRVFDPESQRSRGDIDEVVITPAREFLYSSELRDAGRRKIAAELARVAGNRGQLRDRVERHLAKLDAGAYFDNDEQYLPYFYTEQSTLADYALDAVCIIDEPARIREALSGYETEIRETYTNLLEAGMILPLQVNVFLSGDQVTSLLEGRQSVSFSLLSRALDEKALASARAVPMKQAEPFQGKVDDLMRDIKTLRKRRYRVVCIVSTQERMARLAETLEENDIPVHRAKSIDFIPEEGTVTVAHGELESGFHYPDLGLAVLTDSELYGRQKKRRRFAAVEESARITSYADLTPGDYVVHINHGVGKYAGVQTLEVGGVQRDYLLVQYAGEDRVYVPTDQVAMLQKYIGVEESPPRLNKLGGTEWARTKSRVRESVQDMAKGLLELYAARKSIRGYAFSPDTVWQQEFEDAFPYEETPDQWRAIIEVKRDMERAMPMDRLLCGDVGFGKTEVALRAAFKAAADGKQVVVLVPTTILAQQHYSTFTERFRGFPMKVAMLSRFESEAEQREIVKGIRMGSVDVVIGTHRLLSQDVKFKNLGLVVVDEEQRFGVAQKERLKELRKEVDVLTLTATPIPRTLHMAMVGVRDMSLIETPPENRFPIRTYVVESNDTLVREVILREIDRGGQVYYVHNRVQNIEDIAASLRRLIPEASIEVAHGQMPEEKLERVMLRFLAREFDVLVCTTIIESGIDIPNVNTIVINNAEDLGLAQLYQLRGRVGRTNRVAYAYLMFKRDRVLSEVAEKRLAAIKEFTSLGSGYKIALRDLEIRGAGNILGSEQHGHIAAVGFELYCRLLEETISELRGEPKKPELPPILIDLPVDAFVPDTYVPDAKQKIEVYKKINGIETMEDGADLSREFTDRFGNLPDPVWNLISIAGLKVLARELGVASISGERNAVIVRFANGIRYASQDIMKVARPFKGRVVLNIGKSQSIKVKTQGMSDREILDTLVGVLTEMKHGVAVNQ